MLNKNSNYTLVMICLNEIEGIKYISDGVNKHLHLLNDIILLMVVPQMVLLRWQKKWLECIFAR